MSVEALRTALAAEHAAIFGYGVVGAFLTGEIRDDARDAELVHRDRRDAASLLVEATAAVGSGPDGVDAATVFLTGLFGLLATSGGSGPDRRRCIDLLVRCVAKGIDAP